MHPKFILSFSGRKLQTIVGRIFNRSYKCTEERSCRVWYRNLQRDRMHGRVLYKNPFVVTDVHGASTKIYKIAEQDNVWFCCWTHEAQLHWFRVKSCTPTWKFTHVKIYDISHANRITIRNRTNKLWLSTY